MNEYEEAQEKLGENLYKLSASARYGADFPNWKALTDDEKDFFKNKADKLILNLKWEDGSDMIEVIAREQTIDLPRDCQSCHHHHCYMDSDGIQDCSCDLSVFANTCTQGVPESCPLKLFKSLPNFHKLVEKEVSDGHK